VPFLLAIHYGIEAFKPQASNIQKFLQRGLTPSEARRSSFPMGHQKRRHRFCGAFSFDDS
jgi:hypothetical protein